jgi:hypothetical protein
MAAHESPVSGDDSAWGAKHYKNGFWLFERSKSVNTIDLDSSAPGYRGYLVVPSNCVVNS